MSQSMTVKVKIRQMKKQKQLLAFFSRHYFGKRIPSFIYGRNQWREP